uniref:Uncharacterized protein n=1 Tax=Picea glauca TaxID=3330 RepID=A0A117NIM4_PICGL|nr:hypothetical protein ABT39_MTgene11 [Picea glauca]QHR87977.1 hypothetical protein Q903MT_gene1989 [Picea sitchensis]
MLGRLFILSSESMFPVSPFVWSNIWFRPCCELASDVSVSLKGFTLLFYCLTALTGPIAW